MTKPNPPLLWLVNLPPNVPPPSRNSRPYWGLINHWFPLIMGRWTARHLILHHPAMTTKFRLRAPRVTLICSPLPKITQAVKIAWLVGDFFNPSRRIICQIGSFFRQLSGTNAYLSLNKKQPCHVPFGNVRSLCCCCRVLLELGPWICFIQILWKKFQELFSQMVVSHANLPW